MNNSASPMKIAIDSTSCMNNSASRMSFPHVMNACVSVVLLVENLTSSLKVSTENRKNSASSLGYSASYGQHGLLTLTKDFDFDHGLTSGLWSTL